MQIQRLFVDPSCLDRSSMRAQLSDAQQVNQLSNVLRLHIGDRVDLLDGRGELYRCHIDQLSSLKNRMRCELVIDQIEQATGEPGVKITAALPLLKNGRFEWALEKLTEIGVSKIVPVETSRSIVKAKGGIGIDKKENAGKLVRWQSIVREAAEQCERALIPDVVNPTAIADLIIEAKRSEHRMILCGERKDAPLLSDLLANQPEIFGAPSLVVLVGPEGGFTENEFKSAEDAGAITVSLGRRILRTETASLYSVALLISHLDK